MNVIVKVRPRTEAEEEALNTDLFRLLRLDSDDPWTDQVASNTAVELAVEA